MRKREDVSRYRLGIDAGGTFTDGVAHDVETGELTCMKVSTMPTDQSDGTVDLLERFPVPADDIVAFNHDATVGAVHEALDIWSPYRVASYDCEPSLAERASRITHDKPDTDKGRKT